MAKQQGSDPRELTVDELDSAVGGYGVSSPPADQNAERSMPIKSKWNRVAQQIETHNSGIKK